MEPVSWVKAEKIVNRKHALGMCWIDESVWPANLIKDIPGTPPLMFPKGDLQFLGVEHQAEVTLVFASLCVTHT